MADKRDTKGRFQKGCAPKSPGRPKEYRAFKERCREFMESEGFGLLEQMARKPDGFAIKLLCEYGFGKAPEAEKPTAPPQRVEIVWSKAQRKADPDA